MKKALFALAMAIGVASFGQSQYEIVSDSHDKILKGIIDRDLIEKDTAFKWYKQNQAGYTPNAETVNNIKPKLGQLQFIVFGGTWCSDTKYILPRFYSLADAAGIAKDRITLIGVDRSKKTISHLAEALGVINVPTIIVMKEGKELGRVVEYGKAGQWDKELGEIISSAK